MNTIKFLILSPFMLLGIFCCLVLFLLLWPMVLGCVLAAFAIDYSPAPSDSNWRGVEFLMGVFCIVLGVGGLAMYANWLDTLQYCIAGIGAC